METTIISDHRVIINTSCYITYNVLCLLLLLILYLLFKQKLTIFLIPIKKYIYREILFVDFRIYILLFRFKL